METMEYETARNLTLLFFLERLMERGEPRTLHDLSCQFGSKGFTKEMRQIAGGSQSGLKKFLAQYPAIFVIDGDHVLVNSFEKSASSDMLGGGTRDYIQESKDYFKHKLLQYGIGTEVPIKSLLGHRSQASPQIRHISGQHIKEFTEFLSKHTDTFQIIDECVVLVGCDDLQELPLSERLHLPQPSIDTVATQQMLDFFASCIESKGPILVDQLFHLVTATFPQEQWFSMFKTPCDLSTFLKLFSNCFHIQSNLVTLLQKPVLSDLHIQQQTARAKDCLNNNYTSAALTPSTQQRTQSPVSRGTTVGDFKLNEPVSNVKVTTNGGSGGINNNVSTNNNNNNNNKSEPNSGFDSYIPEFDIKMENLCENNCPKSANNTLLSTSEPNSLTQISDTSSPLSNRSPAMSPIPPATATATPNDRANFAGNKNQSLKQRINNLVIKTLAENEKDKQNTAISVHLTNQTNNANTVANANTTTTAAAATTNTTGSQLTPSPVKSASDNSANNMFIGDTWKIKVLQNTRVIATVNESQFVTEAIAKSATKDEPVVISVDCEGINLGLKGELTLVEIGTVRGEAFIFDVLQCPNIMTEGGLKALLENDNVIKIIHDCRNDSVNLFVQFKVLLRNVFDTQSAHALLQYQEQNKQVYKVKNVSLNTLCEIYNAPKNPMKDQLKNIYRRDQKYWSRRPLSRDMLLYAAVDVLVLINEQLYAKMSEAIKPEFKGLLSELCTEQILMLIKPSEVRSRKKQRKLGTEVADLKQKLSQSNKNIVLSNREIRLLRYLDLTEEEKEKLRGSHKVARKLEKLESIGQDRSNSDSEDDVEPDTVDQEYPSLDSVPSDNSLPGPTTFSPRNSEPPSLTESMQLMDEILSDKTMDRIERIDKLEAILSAATLLPSDPVITTLPNLTDTQSNSSSSYDSFQFIKTEPKRCCLCNCQNNKVQMNNQRNINLNATNNHVLGSNVKLDAGCQTLSTGDIVIMKVYFKEDQEKGTERVIVSSPKRCAQ
ncbi:uncharacterized protein LOC129577220 [Sitodiplosis mosellana]|uniref:uncharacterized protein LOC129577220 n=1 Tax=Sitodiplosis mosellana TaxID=263140 RepID=UPI002444FE49|nr:uncharacterized protein LOC129577220 [Sitodiplosis mosellana]XP_055319842.1 uncharacterized protein LOC129577220 [Sitodiplosis mosellana]XP_055319843.1 uncharacterized protein LOC129577220 [Sitodiplosis mosellana]XP_055319844.1 uncharacterized protein LOC129577220 [Sitodiplosis mosellana]